jgi:hypothetical protein
VHPYLLSTISAADAPGFLLLDGLAFIVMFWAAGRVTRAPRQWFPFGRASKVTWVIASLWFTLPTGYVVLPAGALAALWHLRSLRRRYTAAQPGDLPFAPGIPVRPWDER